MLMVGLLAIATNPDYNAVGMILAVLVLIGALGGLVVVRASGWVLWPGVLLGILLIVTPVNSLRAELIDHRGTAADVVITSAHRQKDRSGRVSWTCGIRRADGLPLPHGSYDGSGCSSAASVGTTITVLVDPEGWAPPAATNAEVPFVGGVYVVGGVAALWALLVLGAARRTLREHGRT
ncbi:hypothetical protein C2142_34930 [Streptomyces sp. CB01881]|nr:hypothetical protein C2142_34930 [Streptomyces sp. CB01881]